MVEPFASFLNDMEYERGIVFDPWLLTIEFGQFQENNLGSTAFLRFPTVQDDVQQ